MRYVHINDRDFVKVDNATTAIHIVQEWLRVIRKPSTIHDAAMWQLLRLDANGTATIMAAHDIPEGYADFDIIEIGDNA